MALSLADVVQSNALSGVAAAASGTFAVTLPSGTTVGNTVIIGATIVGAGSTITTPTGFVKDTNTTKHYIFRRSNVPAGETSWTLTANLASRWACWAMEIANLDLDDPLDGSATSASGVSPQTSGTVSTNSALDTIVLASHAGNNTASAAPTWSSQTNGFTELAEAGTSAGATSNTDVAVSYLFPGTIGPFECSATESVASISTGVLLIYKSATSPAASSFAYHTGFDHGHAGGAVVGSATARLITSASGATIVAGSAKNGGYGLRLTASASQAYWAANATAGQLLPIQKDAAVSGFWVRVISATGVVALAGLADGLAQVASLELVYNVSTTKLGLRWTDGTTPGLPTYQAGTTALSTWVRLSISYRGTKGTTRTAAWTIDGTAETAPTALAGMTAQPAGVNVIALGTAQGPTTYTYAADFDDFRISQNVNDHPLGDQRVILLGVDTGGTVTLSGTSTNFQTFAGATPTMTAWNATTARNAVDEVPPTLGASADGAAQVLVAASDYLEFPMSTYTLAPGEIILGVRALVAGWAAGASAIGLRGWNGTAEAVLWAVADPSFNNSSTAPGWLSCPWYPGGRWTQAQLDAAALRLGFGTSATDIGAHALYLEVVIGSATTQQLFGDFATVDEDPGWSAITQVDVIAPDGGDSTLYYETNTTPTSVIVPPGTAHAETIDALTEATTNYVAFYPPPEGVPDA